MIKDCSVENDNYLRKLLDGAAIVILGLGV